MKRKEVDDVMGGEGAWDNVDQTEGIHPLSQLACDMKSRLTGDNTAAQCPSEDCGGTKAYFYMVQIRSADEPMTAFFKVCIFCMPICAHDRRG